MEAPDGKATAEELAIDEPIMLLVLVAWLTLETIEELKLEVAEMFDGPWLKVDVAMEGALLGQLAL